MPTARWRAFGVVPELSPDSDPRSGGPARSRVSLHVAELHIGGTAVRKWLLGGLGLVLLCCGGGAAAITWFFNRSATDTVDHVDFARPLQVPPLAPSTLDAQGRRVFQLRAQAGDAD